MSCYITNIEDIAKVAKAIVEFGVEVPGIDDEHCAKLVLAQDMYDLNVERFKQYYEGRHMDDVVPFYKISELIGIFASLPSESQDLVQTVKSIDCYLYQAVSEAGLTTVVYKLLTEARERIINSLRDSGVRIIDYHGKIVPQGYQDAEWI